ncbi:MAG: glycosyltransferase 87 family protein [Eubacteriales bacterium]|nr:glycosyltransferase 87 family protein [Eubacteriales bacterium]
MRLKPLRRSHSVYYALFLCSVLFSAVYLALRRGAGIEGFLFDGGGNYIGDFINNLHYPTHEGGPWFDSIWATFPPLAYTFYYLLNVAFTRANYVYELLAYTLITAATAMMMLYSMQRIFARQGRSPSEATVLALCLLLSGVSIFTIERGNSVFNVMVLLLLAMDLRESEKAWQREAALLLIAVAAGFKIYPCLFGLLYLLEKRYKEAVRLLIYGVVLFLVPFAWFSGVEGFKQFLFNQSEIHSAFRDEYLTSVTSVASFCAVEFGWNHESILTVSKVLSLLLGLGLLACTCIAKEIWLRTLLLISLATLVPGWSAEYMAIYYVVPFTLLAAQEGRRMSGHTALYMALFACIFILLPFGADFQLHQVVSWNMLVCFLGVYLITFLAMGDAIHGFRLAREAHLLKKENQ